MNASAPAPGAPGAPSAPQPQAGPRHDSTAGPRITVVVLTRNHVRQTVDTVARLTALPERPHVIVADNGSSDSTVGLLASLFPQVRIVQCLGDRGMAGFNRAVTLAPTEYVACCDDSTWFAPGALACATLWLDEHPQVGVLNARVVGHDEREIHPACLMLNATSPGDDDLPGPALASYMPGACIFRTAVFRALGGYEERLSHGGAEELAALDVLAAGHAIVYCESALAHREPLYRWLTRAQHCTHARNAAWVAWMRLPMRDALAATGRALVVFARQRSLGPAGFALLRGAFWTWRRRRVAPAHVVLLLRQVRRAERLVRAGIPAMAEKYDRAGQRAW
ncbi:MULTISPECIES: glycosyltransferase family 2 protein [unclassified Paraburkholderia]|uniref:glycosyltransferase family 2 protein n=1 Tax=unclassified Paraburkholderia TaxID=2615204 RepID=UPI002AB2FDF2|nr:MULTISPECIES: glycosyltransferase [unclassified Paraburkholderia]